MQSGIGKLSCNKTALKRCTSTETVWNRKAPSLSSPEDEEIFLPKLSKIGMLTCSKVPRFQPRLERRGTDCQCWDTFPPCGKRQALRPSPCPIYRSLQLQRAAGLLPWAPRAGDMDRLLHDASEAAGAATFRSTSTAALRLAAVACSVVFTATYEAEHRLVRPNVP